MQESEEKLPTPESGPNEMPDSTEMNLAASADAPSAEDTASESAAAPAEAPQSNEAQESESVEAETEQMAASADVLLEEEPSTAVEEAAEVSVAASADESSASPIAEQTEAPVAASADESDSTAVSAESAEQAEVQEEHSDAEHDELHPQMAWSELSRTELLQALRDLSGLADLDSQRAAFNGIRDAFRKSKQDEVAAKRMKFIENGGDPEEFEVLNDETDEDFDNAIKTFIERRAEQRREKEKALESNFKRKKEIVEELKKLMDDTSNISTAFDRLHELQSQWRETGPVPAAQADELWKTYNFHVGNFYEVIKINRELRELDQKKNLELKTTLCEKAEQLLFEESIRKSLDEYKALQDQWKEIGAVAREQSEVIWERFRSAGDKLFDRRRSYIQEQEGGYAANLAAKNAICERAEVLVAELPLKTHQHWQEASEKMAVLLEEWKKIGFASRKDNEAVWERFKSLRDNFYAGKEDFYKTLRNTQSQNYKLKVDLCMEAEALKDSTEWKKTGDKLRQLQDQWKNVGPVAKKHSDKLWHRFRTACDAFYEQRNKHFEGMNSEQDENLAKKKALVAEIEAFEPGDDHNGNFEALKSFQSRWIEIGHVPLKEKDSLNKAYRSIIDKQFAKIKAGSAEIRRSSFRNQVQNISAKPDGKDALNKQKNVVQDKIRRLQAEVQTLENNIGFLANSKSKAAEEMRRDIEKKISKAKQEIGSLLDQLKILKDA